MVRRFSWCLALVGLMGCEMDPLGRSIAVSPQYDRMWAEQRRLCQASPQGDHCDVYLRNEIPPAPYAMDGILIQQRRLCFENPTVANCAQAQRMGREAAAAAGRQSAPSAAIARRPAPVAVPEEEDEDDLYRSNPVTTSDSSSYTTLEALPAPTPRRAPRRVAASEASPQCSPDALASLDLVEPRLRASVLRRCGVAAP